MTKKTKKTRDTVEEKEEKKLRRGVTKQRSKKRLNK